MKRFLFALLFLFCVTSAYAIDFTLATEDTYTATAVIRSVPGVLYGIMFTTDGTNDITVDVYNGEDTTGKTLTPQFIVKANALSRVATVSFPYVEYTDLYVAITCAGTMTYKVYYRNR